MRQVGNREEFSSFFSSQDDYDTPLGGIAATGSGGLYLTLKGAYYDITDNQLRKYSPEGRLDLKLGSVLEGTIDLVPFTWPEALAVDKKGTVYMAHGAKGGQDHCNTHGGQYPGGGEISSSATWAREGRIHAHPRRYLCRWSGDIYVSDTHNDRIQVFDAQGRWLLMFNLKDTEEGELSNPGPLTLDKEGNLYVVDRGHARVLKLADPVHHGSVG